MSDLPEIRHIVGEWIARAEEDLSAAELLLSQPGTWPLRTVCFHAQQCIEKYLKALLTSLSHPFPKTHDVTELLSRVSAGTDLGLKVAELDRVNRYGVEARYPGDCPRCHEHYIMAGTLHELDHLKAHFRSLPKLRRVPVVSFAPERGAA